MSKSKLCDSGSHEEPAGIVRMAEDCCVKCSLELLGQMMLVATLLLYGVAAILVVTP